jgi:hypothetical protein
LGGNSEGSPNLPVNESVYSGAQKETQIFFTSEYAVLIDWKHSRERIRNQRLAVQVAEVHLQNHSRVKSNVNRTNRGAKETL